MNWRDLDGPSLLRHFRDCRENGRNAWYVDKDEEKERSTPIQEADGHFRGCPRLGKCRCPANAPRDPFFCEHSERPEACLPCLQKEKKP